MDSPIHTAVMKSLEELTNVIEVESSTFDENEFHSLAGPIEASPENGPSQFTELQNLSRILVSSASPIDVQLNAGRIPTVPAVTIRPLPGNSDKAQAYDFLNGIQALITIYSDLFSQQYRIKRSHPAAYADPSSALQAYADQSKSLNDVLRGALASYFLVGSGDTKTLNIQLPRSLIRQTFLQELFGNILPQPDVLLPQLDSILGQIIEFATEKQIGPTEDEKCTFATRLAVVREIVMDGDITYEPTVYGIWFEISSSAWREIFHLPQPPKKGEEGKDPSEGEESAEEEAPKESPIEEPTEKSEENIIDTKSTKVVKATESEVSEPKDVKGGKLVKTKNDQKDARDEIIKFEMSTTVLKAELNIDTYLQAKPKLDLIINKTLTDKINRESDGSGILDNVVKKYGISALTKLMLVELDEQKPKPKDTPKANPSLLAAKSGKTSPLKK